MNDRIKSAIKQAEHMLFPYCDVSPGKTEISYELLDLCKALASSLDELRAQNAIQAEQLDRLADAVPSAGAHADRLRPYSELGFLYEPGDKVVFVGLISASEYNGRQATISGYCSIPPNKFCPSGCAYYLEGGIPWGDWDYAYQERLELAEL